MQDLDSPAAIDGFVDRFYERVLADPLLAPLFLEVAQVKLVEHLPRIKAYWRKMLLDDDSYRRHMMARHRAIDARRPFTADQYARWLTLFEQSLAAGHRGPVTERAKQLARRIAGNMRRNLEATRPNIQNAHHKNNLNI